MQVLHFLGGPSRQNVFVDGSLIRDPSPFVNLGVPLNVGLREIGNGFTVVSFGPLIQRISAAIRIDQRLPGFIPGHVQRENTVASNSHQPLATLAAVAQNK